MENSFFEIFFFSFWIFLIFFFTIFFVRKFKFLFGNLIFFFDEFYCFGNFNCVIFFTKICPAKKWRHFPRSIFLGEYPPALPSKIKSEIVYFFVKDLKFWRKKIKNFENKNRKFRKKNRKFRKKTLKISKKNTREFV